MNKLSIFVLGVIPGILLGTIYGLYDKNWLSSLTYMIVLILFILFNEFVLQKDTGVKNGK